MSKKVLIISSPPRKGGNSDTLCDNFMNGAKESGNEVQKIFLKDKTINYCMACGFCTKNDYCGCPQKDDMAEILDLIIDSDVIVLSTPVYFYTMCGQLKTLIDRCCAKYTKIKNKEFYYIMTAADGDKSCLNRTIEEFRGFLACLADTKEKGIICGTGVWGMGEINDTNLPKEAYEMGMNI